MMTVKQAAERATVSESLIYAWCKTGLLTHVRFGRFGKRGTIRIDEKEFENFLHMMTVSEMPQDEGELKHIK